MRYEEMTGQDLENLRQQITQYYETYYAELRSSFNDHELISFGTVPEFLKGYRRVITELGRDGVLITHWPSESDSFDFHLATDKLAKDLAAEQCGGEQIIDYPPGSDFGTYTLAEPLKLVVDDQIVWVAQWKRLDLSSRLDTWENVDLARSAAREDLLSYAQPSSP